MRIPKAIIRSLLNISKSSISTTIPPIQNSNFRCFSSINLSHQHNLTSLLHRYAFPPSQIPDFLKKNDFLLQSHPSEIENTFKILLSINPSQDFLISTATTCPSVLQLEFLEKWHLGIKQLGICGITSMAVRNILEVASKSGVSPNGVLKCVDCLKDLGFSEDTVIRVLETMPVVITWREDVIRGKVGFLMGIGIKRCEIDRVLGLFPGFLSFGLENRLKPLLDEFAELGFSVKDVRKEVVRDPKVLSLENGELSHCLEMLRSLKCRVGINKDRIFQDGEFRGGYNAKLRVDCLRKHGLIYRDAFTVLWKEPRVILYEVNEIEKKIDFLVNEMKCDVGCLVEVPEYLGVNLDKHIVPRFNVIEYLRSKGGISDEVGLRKFVKLSRLKFYNMYVKPYPECEKIYGRFASDTVVQTRHPVGMWKLFEPKKYTQSGDDVAGIKWFVKSLPSE